MFSFSRLGYVWRLIEKSFDTRGRIVRQQLAARERWDNGAQWYRLTASDIKRAQTMILNLNRAVGRVGLKFRQRGSVACWLGIRLEDTADFESLCREFGCNVTRLEGLQTAPEPISGQFTPISELFPDDAVGSDVYVLDGVAWGVIRQKHHRMIGAYTAVAETETADLCYFPQETDQVSPQPWILPISLETDATNGRLRLDTHESYLHHHLEWLIGIDGRRKRIGAERVGVVGLSNYVEKWLFSLVHNNLHRENLVLIDGRGHLLDRLLARPHIAHMVREKRVSLWDGSQQGAQPFNPLAMARSGKLVDTLPRWITWLEIVCGPCGDRESLEWFLERGYYDGRVRDLNGLHAWCQTSPESHTEIAEKIKRGIEPVRTCSWFAKQGKRPWVDPRALLQTGALFVTPRDPQNPLNKMMVYGLLQLARELPISVVLHDIELGKRGKRLLQGVPVIVANAPAKTTLFVRCSPYQAGRAAQMMGAAVADEQLEQLSISEGVLIERGLPPAQVGWQR